MSVTAFKCAWCGERAEKASSAVNRARREGLRLFCDRKCAGRGHRTNKTRAQKIAEKRAYDMEYRAKNFATRKVKKAAYYQRTRDPEKERIIRKARMHLHVAYCRRPEYRAWKKKYDRQHKAKAYGPFAEAWMLSVDLNREIKGVMSNEQIKIANGTFGKRQARAREEGGEARRDRHRSA